MNRYEHSLPLCASSNSSPSLAYNRVTRSRRYRLIQFVTFAPCPCALCCCIIIELTSPHPAGSVPFHWQRPWNGSPFSLRPPYVVIYSPCAVHKVIPSAVLPLTYRFRRTAELQRPAMTYSRSCVLTYHSTSVCRMIPHLQLSISVSSYH